MHQTFLKMDTNGDGVVSWEEFLVALKSEIADEQEVRRLFDSIDTDQSGSLDYSEFIAAALMKKRDLQKEVAREAFRFIDKDNSGFIDKKELEHFVRTFGLTEFFEEDAILEVMGKMTNGSKISIDQFEAWLLDRLSQEISEIAAAKRPSYEQTHGSQLNLPVRSRR